MAQAVSALCLLPLKKAKPNLVCVFHMRISVIDLPCAPRVFLRVLRFFFLSKINTLIKVSQIEEILALEGTPCPIVSLLFTDSVSKSVKTKQATPKKFNFRCLYM